MLIFTGIIAVIAMNYSVLTDETVRQNSLLSAFKSRKLYVWFTIIAVIFFTVVLSNV